MPNRAFIAHDRVVTAARMYFRMAMIGLVIAVTLYCAGMYIFYKVHLALPVPELSGNKLIVTETSPKLPIGAIMKYFISPNVPNYFGGYTIGGRSTTFVPEENVDMELRPLLGEGKVPRDRYQRAIEIVTKNRVKMVRTVFPYTLLFFPVFGVGYLLLFSYINKRTEETKFVRGADLIPFNTMKARLDAELMKEGTKNPLRLGEVQLPNAVSRLHMLILGTSGTGKSVCLNRFIQTLKGNGKSTKGNGKSIIYDVKGEFVGKHYDPKNPNDMIFYPFDKRSIKWGFFNEVENYPDIDVLATSLYEPPKDTKEPYWYNAARDVFRSGLIYLYNNGKTKNRDIWEHFVTPVADLVKLYKGEGGKGEKGLAEKDRGALKHIANPESTTASSIISIVQERLQFFRYLLEEENEERGTFSFREFIRNEKQSGTLFLMNIQQYESIFRQLMTLVVDVMAREVLSLTDDRERRITFVIDEFGSLAKMSSIFGFLTMGRSKGGFLVLANQDLGSISNVYGHDQKETFFNNFNIHLTFRLNDPTTSEFLSRGFGKREVIKKYRSSSFSPSDLGDRFTLGEQEKVEEIILPTEFQNLPNFHTYLKIANYGVTKMETEPVFLKSEQPEFEQQEMPLERATVEK